MSRSMGVEEELLLVDQHTAVPAAASEAVLRAAGDAATMEHRGVAVPRLHLEPEAKKEQIEIVSAPCVSADALATGLRAGRRIADAAARAAGVRVAALATSVLPASSHLVESPRFAEMSGRFALTMEEQLTCGLHVHVEVADDDEGVGVLDRIRPWLPVIHALSANSPYWQGADTGFASYRYQAWTRWPSSGPYEVFGSAEAYRGLIHSLVNSGVLLDRGMIYFDARLSDRYPTIEVRVADVCIEVEHAVGIATLVRALVATAAREWAVGMPPHPVPGALLRMAMWTASRYGMRHILLDPATGVPAPATDVVGALVEHVAPVLAEYGDRERVDHVLRDIAQHGTGADRQLRAFERTGTLEGVVAYVADRTHRAA